jgi:hypothetical protein
VIRRSILCSSAGLLATVGLAACGGGIYNAKVGDCTTGSGSTKSVRIVPCSDPTASYRVSLVIDEPERGDKCPDDGNPYTWATYWAEGSKTICVLKK